MNTAIQLLALLGQPEHCTMNEETVALCEQIEMAREVLCPTEDSMNCIWRSSVQGDGFGKSYLALATTDGDLLVFEDGGFVFFPTK